MLEDHIRLVNGQIDYYRRQIERFTPDNPRYRPNQVDLYTQILRRHEALLAFLRNLRPPLTTENINAAGPDARQNAPAIAEIAPVTNGIDDWDGDLPPELLKQLSGRSVKGQSDPLIQIIKEHNGTATLDEILVGLFRKTGEVSKRNLLANRLYRLSKQGLISTIPNRKGIYTTERP